MSDEIKLTKARRAALEKFRDGPLAPYYAGVRKDVARALWDDGLIASRWGEKHLNAGYTVCALTPRGIAALSNS